MIPKEIIHSHYLKPYLKPNWYKGKVELPVAKFTYFFKDDEVNDTVFVTTIKNYENDAVFDSFLSQIDKQIDKLNVRTLTKTILSKVEAFDSLIFAPFKYTIIPKSEFPDFDNKQMMVFPAYCYELSGDESSKDFNAMLRRYLPAVDWNREPAPKVLYKFKNPKYKYGTIGKSLVIDKENNVYNALKKFETNDCFMDVKNTKEEEISITFDMSKKVYLITSNDKPEKMDYDDLFAFLQVFFRKCK